MKFSSLRASIRILFSALVGVLAVARVVAHEPFDVSSRITIYDDRLELVSTLGTDGMRQLLSGAGFSSEKIADSLKARGPDLPVNHPTTLAPRFFQLKNNGQPMVAKRVASVSEGAEILLTLTFPRPAAGTLEARAACYETIPGLRNGVLFIHDESAGPLDATMLSAAHTQLTVSVSGSPQEAKPAETARPLPRTKRK